MRNMVADRGQRSRINSQGTGRLDGWSLVIGGRRGSNRREIEALLTTNHRSMPTSGAESKSQNYRKSPEVALVTSAGAMSLSWWEQSQALWLHRPVI